jgi:hypothetical protein
VWIASDHNQDLLRCTLATTEHFRLEIDDLFDIQAGEKARDLASLKNECWSCTLLLFSWWLMDCSLFKSYQFQIRLGG